MTTYDVTRTDVYSLTVEADSKEDAINIVNEEDQYLNDGTYCGSEFEVE